MAAVARSMTSSADTGSMCHSSLPASIFARSSTSSMSLVSRSPSLTTTLRLSCTCCDGLLHLLVVALDQREDAVVEPLLDDLGEAQHRGERRAQLVADRGEERALGGVGVLGGGPRPLGLLEQPAVLVLLLVQLPVGGGVVERDGGVRRQALHHVQVVLGVGVLLEALDRDEAEHAVLGLERQVDDRLRRLRHRAVFEPLALLVVAADVLLVLGVRGR